LSFYRRNIILFLILGISSLYSQLNINSAEYFINQDPGLGQGIAVESQDGLFDGTLEDVEFNINPADIGLGAHMLYLRFQDDQGTWGDLISQMITISNPSDYQSTTIVAGEYFIDEDPGLGNGTPINAADGSFDGILEDVEFIINPEDIGLAAHTINIRFQDNQGIWGAVKSQMVTVSIPFNNYNVNPYEDLVIIDWGFNSYHMVTIENQALDFMDEGDEIHIVDHNGIVTNDCSEEPTTGMISVASRTYYEDFTYPYNLYMNEGLDDCLENEIIYPGYVKENQSYFLHYDQSNDVFYDLEPNYVNWSGFFGDSPQDTLSFKYYDVSENKIYNLNEVVPFTPDMIEGDAMTPFEFTYDTNSYAEGPLDCDLYVGDYQYNGSITSSLLNVEAGDQIASFVGSQCRGTTNALDSPFNTTVFLLMNYGNAALTLIDSFTQMHSLSNNDFNYLDNSRNIEYFNIYRDGELIDELVNDFYYIDETIDIEGEYCYEIVLTNQYGEELITSMEQCIDIAFDDEYIAGDLNNDLSVNVVDVVILVNLILNGSDYIQNADMNQDGQMNVVDIVLLVNQILNP